MTKQILAIMLCVASCTSSLATETSPTRNELIEIVQACDEAVTACSEYAAHLELILEKERQLSKELEAQRNEAIDKLREPTLPWFVWTIVGIATGIIIGGL